MHVFKKTIDNFLKSNSLILKEFSTFSIGTSRIGRHEVRDAFLTLTPTNQTHGYIPKLKFIHNQGILVEFKNVEFEGHGDVLSDVGKFYGKIKTLRCSFKFAPPGNDKHKIDLIPEFRIDTVYADFIEDSLYFELYERKHNTPGIKSHIKDWVRNSIDGHFHLPRIALSEAHSIIADFIESKMDIEAFKGKIRLFKLQFHDEFLEIGFRFYFEKYPDSE
jgi:hypothetical protein